MRTSKLRRSIGGALVMVLLATGAACSHSKKPAGHPAAAAPTTSAPAAPTSPPPSPGADIKGPLDLLLLGVDTRVTIPDWEPHSDAIMLLHVEPGLKTAYLYSLPRDLLVKMPAFGKAGFGGGTYKLTEAMSRGSRVPGSKTANVPQGYELLTRTLSNYTGIKTFQAGAILNFGGLSGLVDKLGGIDMTVDETVKSHHRKPDGSLRPLKPGGGDYTGPQAVYKPGRHHFIGWQAIDYARQRYGLPNGDYDRQRHQRQLVEAILAKARTQGLNGDAGKLQGIISALGKSLVDVGGRSPLEYAYALRDLTPAGITLVGLPGTGVGSGGAYRGEALQSEGKAFLKAVAQDKVAAFLAAHKKLVNH
ncbi:LCP family protein [Actinoplanes sp. NPDC051411]|jgi:LCP family protein required for cell wall assembly|uniref:LCP family protein n=1 Tax=Actinoplanes sp. NPDC051411 TaxID=3155522 RepID=UPI003447B5C2